MLNSQPLKCDTSLPQDERSLYYQILRYEYDSLKDVCEKHWKSKSTGPFNEDIFHDTLINSINTCCQLQDKNDIFSYLKKSYYLNMVRESSYSRNLLVLMSSNERSPQEYIITKDNRLKSFIREIYEYIKKDKGKRLADIILDYIHGYNYRELTEKYNIKNIFQKAPHIKNYMKKLLISWDSL